MVLETGTMINDSKLNSNHDVHDGLEDAQSYSICQGNTVSQPQNPTPSCQIPIQATGSPPAWRPNPTIHFQPYQSPQQFAFNPYFEQHTHQQRYTSMPYYQQPIPPPQYPPAALETSQRSNKNWSKEEDLQLTIAWDRISSDPVVGVGQKKAKFWDRITKLFVTLMNEKHGIKPEDNVRNSGGCENRMCEIKSQCSRWTAVRARAFSQKYSGWQADDMEKLCHTMHEAEGKGPFKWEDCWKVLSSNPKWIDYSNKKSGKKYFSSGLRAKRQFQATEEGELAHNDIISNNIETQTSTTPLTEPTLSEPQVGGNDEGTCSLNLQGPASIDIKRPPGTKKVKANNQRHRKSMQHSQYQASVSKSLTAGLMNLESATNSRWEKLHDADRLRDLKDEERYNDMKRMQAREHDLKVARERTDISEKMEIVGEKLIVAIQKLDQIDPLSLATNHQKMVYDIKRKVVENYQRQYAELEETLGRIINASPQSVPTEDPVASCERSQKGLVEEDGELTKLVHLD